MRRSSMKGIRNVFMPFATKNYAGVNSGTDAMITRVLTSIELGDDQV